MNEGTPTPPSRTVNRMCYSKELYRSFHQSHSLSIMKMQAKNIARSKNMSAVTSPEREEGKRCSKQKRRSEPWLSSKRTCSGINIFSHKAYLGNLS